MKELKILYVINKKSGSDENEDLESMLQKAMQDASVTYEIYHIEGNNVEKHIKRKIKEFAPDIVVAAGGDGTVNLVASLIMGTKIRLGIIPLGSANGLASELAIPSKPEDAVKLIIEDKSTPMDIVRINEEYISLHLSDVGINARIIKEFEKEGKRGLRAYFKHFLKEIIKPQPVFRCTIDTGKGNIAHKVYMVLIANSNRYGTGANINPGGLKDDGLFEVILIRPYKRWILRSIIGAFSGTFHRQKHTEVFKCRSLTLKISPAQELQVDGELLGKHSEIRAVMQKHAVNIIAGRV